MSAGTYNFIIEQGATFQRTITWKDSDGVVIDLTDYTARMQIRESRDSEEIILELSTTSPPGGITLGDDDGTIELEISAEDTADLDFESAVYDLELESKTHVVTRLLEGKVTISKEITR